MNKTLNLNIPEIETGSGSTTQDHVYRRLRNAIMLGAIEPGTSLTMRGLAEHLDLSPTPVREALRRLSSEHAVEVMGNRRMIIPEMTPGKFEELVALRVTLEVHAAVRSLPYVSDILIEELTGLDDEMDRLVEARDLDALTLRNQEFHRILYAANAHQASMPVIESVWLQLGPFQRQVIKKVAEFYLIDRHKEILEALRQRDAQALSAAIEGDIRDGLLHSGRELLQRGPAPDRAA
ncbi:GntR family transcriptional regulator [Sedimentitalea sp. HM32M-2]|uniref:GntR family transcriptional regulator n=1 Tax=Sedimentitalea sp. HM32M-2 TaxID=3351566 RepID=UPI003638F6DC